MKSKKIRRKEPGSRICITLPKILLEYFRQAASECGISVSKVILTVIRSRNRNVMLLPIAYRQEIRELNHLLEKALQDHDVNPELRRVAESIERYLERTHFIFNNGVQENERKN